MASDKKSEHVTETEGKTAKLKPGFILLHHTERKLERQVNSKNKKGLERFEQEGFKKGPLRKIEEPKEAKKAD